jgi:hypothetical protein
MIKVAGEWFTVKTFSNERRSIMNGWRTNTPGIIWSLADMIFRRLWSLGCPDDFSGALCVGLTPTDIVLAFCLADTFNRSGRRPKQLFHGQLPHCNGAGPPTAYELPPEVRGSKILFVTTHLDESRVEYSNKLCEAIKKSGGQVIGIAAVKTEVSKDVAQQLSIPLYAVEE